jgi:hypothetical protein
MSRLIQHIRSNSVAYAALFVALGGTSVAAVDISNHSLEPVKLNPSLFGGYVREWASVAASGRVVAASDRPTVELQVGLVGDYVITWHTKPTSRCTAVATVDARGSGNGQAEAGYAIQSETSGSTGAGTVVHTYGTTGQPESLPFDVALLCATPQ